MFESDLWAAIREDQIAPHFQPLVSLQDGKVRGYEILARWTHATRGPIPPDQFIPAAERYNVMPAIDYWVLAAVTRHVRALEPAQRPLLAVNVSGNSLSDQAFLDRVIELIDGSGVAASLCFEITETAAVSHLDTAVHFMRELKARGCRFSLDDFGSGLSSFRYLKNLPIDFLKIDGEFVGHVVTDAVDRSVVSAIVQVGHSLGIATVAEKVENGAVMALLADLGVVYAQGFHIARPQPLEARQRPALG